MSDDTTQGQEPSDNGAGSPVLFAKQDAPPAGAPKMFDESYVSELRGEAASYRKQLREAQEALKAAQAAAGDNQALAGKLAELESSLAQKAAEAEAAQKAATFVRLAAKAGVDPDLMNLLDLNKFDLSDEKRTLDALSKLAGRGNGNQARPGGAAPSSDNDLRAQMFGPRKSSIFGG